MNFKNNKYKDLIIAAIVIIILALIGIKIFDNIGVFTGFINKIISLSMSFFYGIIIAYVLNPLVNLFQKRFKIKRQFSILITYAIFIVLLVVGVFYGIPSLMRGVGEILNQVPVYLESAEDFIYELQQNTQIKNLIENSNLIDTISAYLGQVGSFGMSLIENSFITIYSFSSVLVQFILGILISIYVLVEKDKLIMDWKRILVLILKEKNAKRVIEFGRIYHDMIGTYIGIKAIDSSIIGAMAFVLLNIVGSEYAFLLSIVVGITNMIPYFGPFIGEIVGFLINVFVSPVKGLMVFLVLFSLQMFDGWYLDPKLIGNKVGVRPFWIIYAVVIGGGFFGPVGMLLASPTAATIKIYYSKLLDRKKELIQTIE